ncbi:MAG: DUF2007 domain-containing protein [Mycobacterium leprae]
MGQYDAWIEVFRTGDQVEAEVIRGLLQTNGFPVVVEAKGLKSMAVLLGHAAQGELIVKVPPDRADEARAMLAADAQFPEEEEN